MHDVFFKTPLRKGGDNLVGAADQTATGRGAVVGAVLCAGLAASRAVGELVASHAGGAVWAGEDASVHVRGALLDDNGQVVAVHVDHARDVKGAVFAVEREFAPGVGDLAVDELGVGVDGGEAAAEARGERDGHAGLGCQGVGDERGVGVDPAGCGSPDDQLNVFGAVVDELASVGAVGADPGAAARVAAGSNAESGEKGALLDLGKDSGADEGQVGKDGEWGERTHV